MARPDAFYVRSARPVPYIHATRRQHHHACTRVPLRDHDAGAVLGRGWKGHELSVLWGLGLLTKVAGAQAGKGFGGANSDLPLILAFERNDGV